MTKKITITVELDDESLEQIQSIRAARAALGSPAQTIEETCAHAVDAGLMSLAEYYDDALSARIAGATQPIIARRAAEAAETALRC